jgi:hypothetical protein
MWIARDDRPLVLLRRNAGGLSEERFPFGSLAVNGGDLQARAEVTDTTGARWDVRLRAAAQGAGRETAEGGEPAAYAGTLRWTLLSGPAAGVFVGHRLTLLADPADLYVCLPGSVYDGNDITPVHRDIPRVSRTGVLDVPTTSLASPCAAFHARSACVSLVVGGAQRASTADGAGCTTGFRYDARDRARPTIAVMAPLFRTAHYKLANRDGDFRFHFLPVSETGATLSPGEWIELTLSWSCGKDAGIPAFFRRLHTLRPIFRGGHKRTRSLPLSEAAALVEYNQNHYHWQEGPGFYANATEVDGRNANQLMTGWGSGIITGYGLLACGDAGSRARAARMIGFICATGVSPSGLFYSCFQDGKWEEGRTVPPGTDATPWRHIRTAEDGTLYLIRACMLEEGRGNPHPAWRAAVRSNLDSMARIWKRFGEFGREVDRLTGEITEAGTAAGTLCIAALAEGSTLLGDRRYLATAGEAADSYYARFVATGHACGGPLDIMEAADSESCLMFPCAFMAVYERTGEERFLRFAVDAADQFASWVLAWDGTFPPGTTLDRLGIQTIGGVIANAQNHHIGPGGASTSLSSLLAIYRATREERFLALLEDHATALQQYLSREDGHIDRLAKGMMTEQINLTDAMNHATGEIWNISASWSANNILLALAELPGVYIDPGRRRVALLDHVEAAAAWDRGTVEVINPTDWTARTRVEVDGRPAEPIELAPHGRKAVALTGGSR